MFVLHLELKSAGWPQFSARTSKSSSSRDLRRLLICSRTISHLLPMFLQMLKDEFPDVRLNIISKLELVNNGVLLHICPNNLSNKC